MARMIFYHGIALETVAPVMIEDIRVSPIIQAPVARDRPLNAGQTFIRTHEGTRSVGITFAIMEQNPDIRQRYIEALTAWALTEKPEPMQLPNHANKLLNVLCTGLPEPSTRQWWESRLNLNFTAYDPYFYSITEKSAACGTAFVVLGNAPPRMRITHTLSEEDNLTYSDGTKTMAFSNVPAGSLEIDLNKQTARVGTSSIMSGLSFGSRFIIPKTGSQTITGSGTVRWRERWQA